MQFEGQIVYSYFREAQGCILFFVAGVKCKVQLQLEATGWNILGEIRSTEKLEVEHRL